jgi:tRNA(Arg) A34 adenosine deaminase TadA
MVDEQHLRAAITLAVSSVANGGGPFGAVVVHGDRVVGRGTNRVVNDGDPTAHAEVVAIREACARLGTHVLEGCTLYASCEPCPMCLAAIHWARIDAVVHASSAADATAAGFDDDWIHDELARPAGERKLRSDQRLREEGRAAFEAWENQADRVPY